MIPLHPDLLAERVLHRPREAAPRAREGAQRHGEDALELEHRLLVEDDRVELARARARRARGTTRWRPSGNAASFLRRERRSSWTAAHRHAVDRRARPPSRGSAPRCRGCSSVLARAASPGGRARSTHPARSRAAPSASGQERERRQEDEVLDEEHHRAEHAGERRWRAGDRPSTAARRARARASRRGAAAQTRRSCASGVVHVKCLVAEDAAEHVARLAVARRGPRR